MTSKIDSNTVASLTITESLNQDLTDASHENLLEYIEKLKSINAEQNKKIEKLKHENKENKNIAFSILHKHREKYKETTIVLQAENKSLEVKNSKLKAENDRLKRNEIIHNRIFDKLEKDIHTDLIVCKSTQPEAVFHINQQLKAYEDLHNQLTPKDPS